MGEPRCPTCREPVRRGAASFPFGSERCRVLDLGRWIDERYRIAEPAFLAPDDLLPPTDD